MHGFLQRIDCEQLSRDHGAGLKIRLALTAFKQAPETGYGELCQADSLGAQPFFEFVLLSRQAQGEGTAQQLDRRPKRDRIRLSHKGFEGRHVAINRFGRQGHGMRFNQNRIAGHAQGFA
jgi:hypothetical protein